MGRRRVSHSACAAHSPTSTCRVPAAPAAQRSGRSMEHPHQRVRPHASENSSADTERHTMTQSNQRRLDQIRHEDNWAKCWVAPLGKFLNAQDVRTSRPNDVATPPDATFHVRHSDGNETTTWGEITDVYYDETEARLLWSGTSKGKPRIYTEPDAQTADEAEKRVERKLKKYPALVSEQGRGHLLLVISSPLTTRSTWTEMESRRRRAPRRSLPRSGRGTRDTAASSPKHPMPVGRRRRRRRPPPKAVRGSAL